MDASIDDLRKMMQEDMECLSVQYKQLLERALKDGNTKLAAEIKRSWNRHEKRKQKILGLHREKKQ
jgi:hypothetical protein